jgi:type II secretory pathway pseudopilin PulG
MATKSKGVSLLEILIVMGIFTIVSIGVTNLSIKAIDFNRTQQTLGYQDHVFNQIQDDLRHDMRSALAVWLSDSGGGPSTYQQYFVQQACGGAHPNTQPLTARDGDTLNILRQISYNHNPASPVVTLQTIRYQFVTSAGSTYLVRLENTPFTDNNEPSDIWPKDTTSTNCPYSMPTYGGTISSVTSPNKVYNPLNASSEDFTMNGEFEVTYSREYNPSATSGTANCTFFVKTVSLNNLTLTATGYMDKYDKAFGKANLIAPRLTFDLNTSLKFF